MYVSLEGFKNSKEENWKRVDYLEIKKIRKCTFLIQMLKKVLERTGHIFLPGFYIGSGIILS